MKFVLDIDPKKMDEFVLNHPFNHYMKTSFWAEYEKAYEGYETRYAGVEDEEGNLLATTILLKKKFPYAAHPYIYIPTGMCVDYYNEELFHFFIDSLVEYARSEKVTFLRIDPNVERWHKDIDGNVIDDGFNNEYITEYLKERGFRHKGYGNAYNGSWINRFTLKIDISGDMKTIQSKFSKSKVATLKRLDRIGAVTTRHGTREELKYLVMMEYDLTKTQGFKPHKVEFFERLMDKLAGHIIFYVTEVDLKKNLDFLLKEFNSKDVQSDESQKTKRQKEIDECQALLEKYGEKEIIGTAIYVYYGNKSWNLYNYKRDDFYSFSPTDHNHITAIKELKEKGVTLYDMVGFSGKTNKEDPFYGLYYYKRRFGPDYVEQIGEFDYIYDQKDFDRFFFLYRNIRRVRRKIYDTYYRVKKLGKYKEPK